MHSVLRFSLLLVFMFASATAMAQQSQDFGQYVVHFNALKTDLIPPEVAKQYSIQRSDSIALLNVTVLRKVMNNPGTPVKADVTAYAMNLTGQRRDITIREISEPQREGDSGAVYYIGEFRIHNRETFDFTLDVKPQGEDQPLQVRFRQQFFTE